jgi:Raf kinase inhibitor-like YbhB/YbcL family protein
MSTIDGECVYTGRMQTRTTLLLLALAACSSDSASTATTDGGGADTSSADSAAGPGDSGGPTDSGQPPADGGADSPAPPDAGGDAAGPFALTSAALAEGATFAAANTCDGADTSPPFQWTGAPASAKSFAIVLTDKTNSLVHWTIYDIGAQATGAPAAIEGKYMPADPAGSKQAPSIKNAPVYAGPCPPQGVAAHTYEFALYAADVAQLPGTSATTTKEQIVTLLATHGVAVAKLTGKYGR